MALSRSLFILAISATSAAARGLPSRPLLHLRGGNAAETLAAEMAAAATKPFAETATAAAAEAVTSGGYGWLSILPPLVALGASVALKQVIVALILGVWTGTVVLSGGKPIAALLQVFDTYLVGALADKEHAGVLLFTLLLGGTIGIVQRAGGGLGLARLLSSYITSASRALYAAYALASTTRTALVQHIIIILCGGCSYPSRTDFNTMRTNTIVISLAN